MPHARRERRPIRLFTLMLLRPILRYSESRDAYILRGIGRHHGPVFQRRQHLR